MLCGAIKPLKFTVGNFPMCLRYQALFFTQFEQRFPSNKISNNKNSRTVRATFDLLLQLNTPSLSVLPCRSLWEMAFFTSVITSYDLKLLICWWKQQQQHHLLFTRWGGLTILLINQIGITFPLLVWLQSKFDLTLKDFRTNSSSCIRFEEVFLSFTKCCPLTHGIA